VRTAVRRGAAAGVPGGLAAGLRGFAPAGVTGLHSLELMVG
jgi:hypothetical protein